MIKLINYQKYASREVFISKTMIHNMQREDGMTRITMEGGCSYTVKETPEEILAMPDIEEGNKVIDWEQRRYEIAKDITASIYSRLNVIKDGGALLNYNYIVASADGLIRELKKGGEKCIQ